MEKLEIGNEQELSTIAQKILSLLSEQKPENAAAVLALSGDLGVGKTAFTKALAQELGIEQIVQSPTFVIMKGYETGDDTQATTPFSRLVHIDAYRIDDIDEMRVLRFDEILAQKDTIICIEWAERIQSLLPEHTLFMDIAITGETSRTITLS